MNILRGSELTIKQGFVKELFLYTLVGGIATIVEWAAFYVFTNCLFLYYIISTILAYIISTFSNWLFGRLLVFKKDQVNNFAREIISIYIASVIGLIFNLLIMWLFVEILCIDKMTAKIVATIVVFGWNFFIRKLVIYKDRKNGNG